GGSAAPRPNPPSPRPGAPGPPSGPAPPSLAGAIAASPLASAAPLALLPPAGPRRAAGFVLAGTAAWVAFFLRSGGDLFDYSRMMFPLVPALSVLALAGIAELARRLAPHTRWAP